MGLTNGITDSIRNVAATIAHDAMGYYSGNTSSDPIVSSS